MTEHSVLDVAVSAARAGGEVLAGYWRSLPGGSISEKQKNDFVTRADEESEEAIVARIRQAHPQDGFLGEEGGRRGSGGEERTWIIDPLDGTTNFLHGVPQFCISVGLERDGQIVAGVIYDPAKDEMFIAEKGKGAYLNNRRIRVSGRTDMADALAGCGLPHIGRGDHGLFFREAAAVMAQVGGMRRFGSAALDLAYVAAGRLDLYWERGLNSWDMAAGLVMIREAGGFVSDAEGGSDPLAKGSVACGNESLHRELVKLLKQANR